MEFKKEELNLVREWFDVVQDINPNYLKKKDFVLAKKIYENLGFRVPVPITKHTSEPITQANCST
jgi:hypothetical protein